MSMPEYIYKHPEKEEYVSIIQGMNEKHIYIDKESVEWQRVLFAPNMNIDENIDPFNKNQYIEKTKNMKGSVGDLMDHSRELSEKRAATYGGEDPIKRKYLDDWSQKRGGMTHPEDKKKRTAENKHMRVDY